MKAPWVLLAGGLLAAAGDARAQTAASCPDAAASRIFLGHLCAADPPVGQPSEYGQDATSCTPAISSDSYDFILSQTECLDPNTTFVVGEADNDGFCPSFSASAESHRCYQFNFFSGIPNSSANNAIGGLVITTAPAAASYAWAICHPGPLCAAGFALLGEVCCSAPQIAETTAAGNVVVLLPAAKFPGLNDIHIGIPGIDPDPPVVQPASPVEAGAPDAGVDATTAGDAASAVDAAGMADAPGAADAAMDVAALAPVPPPSGGGSGGCTAAPSPCGWRFSGALSALVVAGLLLRRQRQGRRGGRPLVEVD